MASLFNTVKRSYALHVTGVPGSACSAGPWQAVGCVAARGDSPAPGEKTGRGRKRANPVRFGGRCTAEGDCPFADGLPNFQPWRAPACHAVPATAGGVLPETVPASGFACLAGRGSFLHGSPRRPLAVACSPLAVSSSSSAAHLAQRVLSQFNFPSAHNQS